MGGGGGGGGGGEVGVLAHQEQDVGLLSFHHVQETIQGI